MAPRERLVKLAPALYHPRNATLCPLVCFGFERTLGRSYLDRVCLGCRHGGLGIHGRGFSYQKYVLKIAISGTVTNVHNLSQMGIAKVAS